jgi:Ca2+/Na+ antiporter
VLRRFLLVDDGDEARIQDILKDSISHGKHSVFSSWHWPALNSDSVILLFVILFFVVVGWMLWNRVAVWKVAIVVLLCSVAWTWFHMYKKALAKKQAALFRLGHVPATCLVEKQGWLAAMTDAVASLVGHKSNHCEDYYEALLVDPFWEVTPLAAFSETLSQFVLSPLRAVGHFVGLFFGEVLAPIPLAWKIPVLIIVFVLFAFVLLMACRYKISSPLLLRIEPSHSGERSKASFCVPSDKKEALPYPTEETQLDRLFPRR